MIFPVVGVHSTIGNAMLLIYSILYTYVLIERFTMKNSRLKWILHYKTKVWNQKVNINIQEKYALTLLCMAELVLCVWVCAVPAKVSIVERLGLRLKLYTTHRQADRQTDRAALEISLDHLIKGHDNIKSNTLTAICYILITYLGLKRYHQTWNYEQVFLCKLPF